MKKDRDKIGVFCSICEGKGDTVPIGYTPDGMGGSRLHRFNKIPCENCSGSGYVYKFPVEESIETKKAAEKAVKKSKPKPPKRIVKG